jgi:endonuclease/exonuclease/phosphatase family metal-dependent hydrolase
MPGRRFCVDIKHLIAVVLCAVSLLTACDPIQNFEDPIEPLFAADYADRQPEFDGEIKVITWNIKFGQAVETAITELTEVEELREADIILLQEMDEQGVDEIARALQYNYVYFPASIHTRHDKNFGNAILSPWPITNPAKITLPFANPRNSQTRIATRAVVMVGDKEVLAYSVHTETPWLGQGKRYAQIESLIADVGDDYDHVVVGGDFNTFFPHEIAALDTSFEAAGLARVSAGAGPTFESTGVSFSLDHTFAKGMSPTANGVWAETEASDHYPLWVDLTFDDPADEEAYSGWNDYFSFSARLSDGQSNAEGMAEWLVDLLTNHAAKSANRAI